MLEPKGFLSIIQPVVWFSGEETMLLTETSLELGSPDSQFNFISFIQHWNIVGLLPLFSYWSIYD